MSSRFLYSMNLYSDCVILKVALRKPLQSFNAVKRRIVKSYLITRKYSHMKNIVVIVASRRDDTLFKRSCTYQVLIKVNVREGLYLIVCTKIGRIRKTNLRIIRVNEPNYMQKFPSSLYRFRRLFTTKFPYKIMFICFRSRDLVSGSYVRKVRNQ